MDNPSYTHSSEKNDTLRTDAEASVPELNLGSEDFIRK